MGFLSRRGKKRDSATKANAKDKDKVDLKVMDFGQYPLATVTPHSQSPQRPNPHRRSGNRDRKRFDDNFEARDDIFSQVRFDAEGYRYQPPPAPAPP